VNLDPAVTGDLPFSASIDIRDTVNYKKVMSQYGLGPNGGIVTALNLFATRFDQVLGLFQKRAPTLDHIVLDTPGQIEVFTWSASGAIITESLAGTLPTCVVYVVDTVRAQSPATFIANMMYACSILYKTRLPLVLCFNKIDIVAHEFAREWMTNFEAFQEAAQTSPGSDTYMGSLTQSMGLVLEEFYRSLQCVGVSAATGQGFDTLFAAVEEAKKSFLTDYRPALIQRAAARAAATEQQQKDDLAKLARDLKSEGGLERSKGTSTSATKGDNVAIVTDDDDDDKSKEHDEL